MFTVLVKMMSNKNQSNVKLMNCFLLKILIFCLVYCGSAYADVCIPKNKSEFVAMIQKSEITVVIDVDNGKKEISSIVKGDINKYPWIIEGEYKYVGKEKKKKQILYSLISTEAGFNRVKIWQITNGVVRYSINESVEIGTLKALLAEG